MVNGLREVETPGAVRATEESTGLATICGYCSLAYPHENDDGQKMDLPTDCKRCGCPLNASKVRAYADEQAQIQADPALSALDSEIKKVKG